MVSQHIVVKYEVLEKAEAGLSQLSDSLQSMTQTIQSQAHNLQQNGWKGEAAEAFFAEMDSIILPRLVRLHTALAEASQTMATVNSIFADAEQRASQLFSGEDAPATTRKQGGFFKSGTPTTRNTNLIDGNLYDRYGQPVTGQPDVILVNGITTDSIGFLNSMDQMEQVYAGKVTAGIFNKTDGILADLYQAGGDKESAGWGVYYPGRNPAVDGVINTILNDQDGKVEIVAHSQGSAIVAAALQELKRRNVDLTGVKVTTLGGYGSDFPSGPEYHHYIHRGDPVPLGGQVFDRGDNIATTMRYYANVTMIDDQTPLNAGDDHNLDSYLNNLPLFQADERSNSGFMGQIKEIREVQSSWQSMNILHFGWDYLTKQK